MNDLSQTTPGAPARQALLAQLRRAQRGVAEPGGIPRRPAGLGEVPLSFGQEQLWFLEQLAPESAAYNVPVVLRLRGRLERAALQRALDALVARHEALRTSFAAVGGSPVQVVADPSPLPLAFSDLEPLGRERAEAELSRLVALDVSRPLRLEPSPPLRSRLVRLGESLHVLVVTIHHVIFDGWSLEVFLRELAALYEQEVARRPCGLPELAVQYADYALWQRDRLQGDRLERLESYWSETLAGAPVLQLPTDRPRPPVQRFEGASETLELPADLMGAVRKLGREEAVTPFMVLLGAFQALLARYGGQDDIVVGTPSANRDHRELEPLIGYFVNMLAVRTDLSGDPPFRELLGRVRRATVGAYAHQELPFTRLVQLLRPQRDPSRSPIFQVGFTLESGPPAPLHAGGLEFEVAAEIVPASAAKLDLGLFVRDIGGNVQFRAEFSTALFDAGTVRRMLAHLGVLIGAAVQDPGRHVSELAMLTEVERHRQLVEWNATGAAFPQRCLHELFEDRARLAPQATAAVMGEDGLTYGELDRRANRLARHLRSLGVGPDVLVGVCLQRGLAQLVAVLGILKAGGAYLPLDPTHPPARLAFMLEDAGVSVAVAEEVTVPMLRGGTAAVVCLEDEQPRLAALAGGPLASLAGPRHLAYALYTSGSTGRPKGALIEHRSVVNFITSVVRAFGITPADRVLQYASLSFDSSVFEIFTALFSGATLCLAPDDARLSPARLSQLLRDERVTVTDLPPAVMALLPGDRFPALRVALAGGETISADLVRDWARPGRRFFNGYGPTETTVAVTLMECSGDADQAPPIGWAMPNHQLYVLDPHGNPVPVGVPGELFVGGVGLARGYLNRPGLTAERFVPDPFAGEPGRVLYRTGDLVRQRTDGCLVFLGRLDDQVKVHGLRIELGEIESVLAEHPSVAQAVVAVREDHAGDPQLVAYLTAGPGLPPPTPDALRRHLGSHLPVSMAPSRFVVLDAFPRNPNGKVDRLALPAPGDAAGGIDEDASARTLLEAVLAELFAEVLGIAAVGVHDGFFELGGSSMQAMRLLSRLGEALEVDVGVADIFQAPTVAALAELLRTARGVIDEPLPSGVA